MKRVKCGAFWIEAKIEPTITGWYWRGYLFSTEKSAKQFSMFISTPTKTIDGARRALKRFIATMNRDNSLPVNETVS